MWRDEKYGPPPTDKVLRLCRERERRGGLPKIACGQRNELSSQREERRGRGMLTKSPPAAKSLKEEASSLGEKGRGATYFNLSASVTAKIPSTKKKRSNLLPNFVRKRERERRNLNPKSLSFPAMSYHLLGKRQKREIHCHPPSLHSLLTIEKLASL